MDRDCISLLLDLQSCCWTSECAVPSAPEQPSLATLKATVVAFKESLRMSDDAISKIERETKDQRLSSLLDDTV